MKKILTLLVLLSSIVLAQTAGTLKWSYEADDYVKALPAIADDGTIYICSFDGFLHALNTDGTVKWKYEALFMGGTSYIRYAPAIGIDGTIYFCGSAGTVYAVNPDGTEKWVTDITVGQSEAAPAIASDGSIIITTSMSELVKLNPSDGSVIWNKSTSGLPGYSSPAIDANGRIFLPFDNLNAVGPDGVELWESEASGGHSSVAIGADGTIYNGSSDTYLYATNPDGTLKWKFKTGDDIWGSPVIGFDGVIYIYSTDSYLYAVNPDGTEKWKFGGLWNLLSHLTLTPVIGADGTIYIGGGTEAYQTKFYALNQDGTVKWELTLVEPLYSLPTITSDGLILVGYDTQLIAINCESMGLANTSWPKYRNTQDNRGYTSIATSVKQIGNELPENFLLSQNYPNPFNPSTTISFSIPNQVNVKLSIYNAIGEEVAELINENITAGFHQVTFDASNLSSGIYFYRISAGNFIDTKKMILLR